MKKYSLYSVILVLFFSCFFFLYFITFLNYTQIENLHQFETEVFFRFDIMQVYYATTSMDFCSLIGYSNAGHQAIGSFFFLKLLIFYVDGILTLFSLSLSVTFLSYLLKAIAALFGTVSLFFFYRLSVAILKDRLLSVLSTLFLGISFVWWIMNSIFLHTQSFFLLVFVHLWYLYTHSLNKRTVFYLSLLSGLILYLELPSLLFIMMIIFYFVLKRKFTLIPLYISLLLIVTLLLSTFTSMLCEHDFYNLPHRIQKTFFDSTDNAERGTSNLSTYSESLLLSIEQVFFYTVSPPHIETEHISDIHAFGHYRKAVTPILFLIVYLSFLIYIIINSIKFGFDKNDMSYVLFVGLYLFSSIFFYSFFSMSERFSHLQFLFPFTFLVLLLFLLKSVIITKRVIVCFLLAFLLLLTFVNNILYILFFL